jgi:hypothetical protein
MNDVLDYYVDLLAKQGHKNIYLGCTEDPSDPGNPQVLVESARWNGKYGYVFSAYFGVGTIKDPTPEQPVGPVFYLNMSLVNTQRMPPTTDEDPALDCGPYPLDRFARVLKPYGLIPFQADDSFRSIFNIDGSRTDPEARKDLTPLRVGGSIVPRKKK